MSRRILARVFTIAGFALLVAAAVQYGYMGLRQQQMRAQYETAAARRMLTPLPRQDRPEPAALHSGPLRLRIPSIGLDEMIVHGTTYGDLLAGPGLLAGSSLPGNTGNTVIAGHRDTFFRRVAQLHAGDAIFLEYPHERFTYRVAARQIVSPSQTAVLGPTALPTLTLVTCYPTYWVGPAPDRLIIRARLQRVQPVF